MHAFTCTSICTDICTQAAVALYAYRLQVLRTFVAILLSSVLSPPALAANNALLELLSQQLGISEQQATDGLTALMNVAKQHLSATDYTRVLTAMPDLQMAVTAAIAASGGTGGISDNSTASANTVGKSASTAPGNKTEPSSAPPTVTTTDSTATPSPQAKTTDWLGQVGAWLGTPGLSEVVQLTQTFAKLGLSVDTIGKFLKIFLDYVNGVGGPELMKLLAGALSTVPQQSPPH